MPVIYPEGGMPGLLLKQRERKKPAIDTFRIQLVPLRAAPKTKINMPEDVVTLVKEMEDYDREYAKIIHLDTKNQVMGVETISIGSLSASIVHPRETVKGAILNNSANVIFIHNHPSGICGPSNEDIEISGKLKEAFETVGIVLLDSIIVGKGCHYSLRETGFISGRPEHAMMSGSVREPPQGTKNKVRSITAMTEYIKAPDLERSKRAGEKIRGGRFAELTVRESTGATPNNIEAFLERLTVDSSMYIPDYSLVVGAAIPDNGLLLSYHITDDPGGVMQKLKSNIPLCKFNHEGDLGCGLYVSSVPQYWRGRSTAKWEFARQLNRAQRQSLVNVILSDPRYRKGGGYLTDFEVGYLNRDLKQFAETGDVNLLAGTGNQPYNVRITAEIARKAGVPEPKEPGLIKVKLRGKFINAAGLYSNAEIVNRAQAWAVVNRPKLLQYNKRASTQNIVNAWLCSMGYCGAFTKSGMSTNPEMVIWGRKAIIDARITEQRA